MKRSFLLTMITCMLVVTLSLLIQSCQRASARENDAIARKLVREALKAEAGGQKEQHDALITQALSVASDCAPAHWHAGHVRVDNQWLTLHEAQLRASEDTCVADYKRLRDAYAGSAQGQILLASFCRRNTLADRERFHWWNVLRVQPRNKEAIAALGLKPHRGALLTEEQIEQQENSLKQWKVARQRWTPQLQEMKEAIERGEPDRRKAALARLRDIDDPSAIPFLETIASEANENFTFEIVAVLGRMEQPDATMSLVKHAVLSDFPSVRQAAAEQLRKRSLFAFVPVLMGSLATPLECSFSVVPLADGMFASYGFYREGALVDYSWKTWGENSRLLPNFTVGRRRILQRTGERAFSTAVNLQRTVAQTNATAQIINGRINDALTTITGVETDGRPESWWKWWQEYNDLYVYEEKPVVEYEQQVTLFTHECFLPGTPVWTETGPVAIEKVRVGDRVLSQHPDTGELAFKLVVQTTVRPTGSTVRIGVDDEDIYTTLGHPLWVAGQGWRMAKHLKAGDCLHSAIGPVIIERVGEGPEAQAHNLVVADFQTYFLGKGQILAHDNTIRRPTAATVPGLLRE